MNWQLWVALVALAVNIPFYGFVVGKVRTKADAILDIVVVTAICVLIMWGGFS